MHTPRLAIVALAAFVAAPALLAAQSAAQPKLVVPNVPDIRIETRRTSDRQTGIVVTDVLHLKGARQRREERIEATPNTPPNWAHPGMTLARISQCDERRILLLNHDAKTYVYEPIRDPASFMASGRVVSGRQAQSPSPQEASGPTITITIDAVDTGERKQFGRYIARHVITTRTTEEGPGDATVTRQDGWYIDAPDSNCTTWEGAAVVFARLSRPGNTPPNMVIRRLGNARLGYPIEETYQTRGRYAVSSRIELVDISESPLDHGLFTVPPDFRAAMPHPYGGYDLTKPDTLLNRLQSYREVATAWADYIRRYGLQGILPGTQPPARY